MYFQSQTIHPTKSDISNIVSERRQSFVLLIRTSGIDTTVSINEELLAVLEKDGSLRKCDNCSFVFKCVIEMSKKAY